MTCAYWDEEEHRWSIQGVTTIGTSNGELRCATTHLSIFAGAPRFIQWVRWMQRNFAMASGSIVGLYHGYTWLYHWLSIYDYLCHDSTANIYIYIYIGIGGTNISLNQEWA